MYFALSAGMACSWGGGGMVFLLFGGLGWVGLRGWGVGIGNGGSDGFVGGTDLRGGAAEPREMGG